jgi:hypothetical protein
MSAAKLETWVAAAQARLIAAGLCAGAVTSNRETPSRDEQLPVADVFVTDDEAKPMGGGVTGTFEFEHTAKLCVEVRDHANDGPELRQKLRAHVDIVYAALLPTFWDWAADAEGCGGARFAYVNPPEAGETEGRALIQFDILYRSTWDPSTAALPNLATVSVDAGDGIGATVPVPTP